MGYLPSFGLLLPFYTSGLVLGNRISWSLLADQGAMVRLKLLQESDIKVIPGQECSSSSWDRFQLLSNWPLSLELHGQRHGG